MHSPVEMIDRAAALPPGVPDEQPATDQNTGAAQIANRAANALIQFCDNWHGDEREFKPALVVLCRRLLSTQPGVASLLNLCHDVLQATERDSIVFVQGRAQSATPPQAASNAALRFTAF